MKRILIAIILSLSVLAACSSNDNSEASTEANEDNIENVEAVTTDTSNNNNDEEESGIEVKKKLLNVEVTLPKMFFEDETGEIDYDDIETDLMDEGIKDVTINNDGSITLKMSKKLHKEMMTELEDNLQATIDDILNDEDVTSIKDIDVNKNFTEWQIVVDQTAYENSFDGFSIIGLGIGTLMYQAFDGQDIDQTKAIFNLIDEATNEQFDQIIYPDDISDELE